MLKETLTTLRMKGALEALDTVSRLKNKEEFTQALLQAELDYRHHRKMRQNIKSAAFPVEKEWADIDPMLNPEIDFKSVQALGNGDFIRKKENLCLLGPQGTGKTHSLIALGRELCKDGYSVKFFTACSLVNALEEAKEQLKLSKFMQAIVKPSLVVIDELGYVPFTENGARLLFDVFARRYEHGSIAVSTNLSFEQWVEVFGSIELTAALVDRFTHNAHICVYDGDSGRLKRAKQRQREGGKQTT